MSRATVTDVKELPEIMTIEQVQQFLGISRPKAYELANMATFPAVRLGRVIRVPKLALLRWLDRQAGEEMRYA
jgi:excisionase family DNA binding protein